MLAGRWVVRQGPTGQHRDLVYVQRTPWVQAWVREWRAAAECLCPSDAPGPAAGCSARPGCRRGCVSGGQQQSACACLLHRDRVQGAARVLGAGMGACLKQRCKGKHDATGATSQRVS